MTQQTNPAMRQSRCRGEQQESAAGQITPSSSSNTEAEGGREDAVAIEPRGKQRYDNDQRESLVNDRRRGTKYEITPKVEEVTAIHGFMNDLDCKMLDPAVVGEECVESAAALYEQHVRIWLDRDPVLSKAEVRDSGHGLHVILWLDQPIIVAEGKARSWDAVARGICKSLPGDPNLNGIIALTRPVGAMNTKYDPPREVRLLRSGEPVTRAEVLDLNRRLSDRPAHLWMRLFFGGERVDPCPLCNEESLGIAGDWKCRCYGCGWVDAASLVYRFYSPDFRRNKRKESNG
jgi:hypothetical protein